MARREKPIVRSGLHTNLHCGNLRSYHTNLIATRETDPKARLRLSNLTLKLILIGQEKIIGKETRILLILLCTLYTHKHFGL